MTRAAASRLPCDELDVLHPVVCFRTDSLDPADPYLPGRLRGARGRVLFGRALPTPGRMTAKTNGAFPGKVRPS